jgi:hypothetical protein
MSSALQLLDKFEAITADGFPLGQEGAEILDQIERISRLIEQAKSYYKAQLATGPHCVPGWTLRPGAIRRSLGDFFAAADSDFSPVCILRGVTGGDKLVFFRVPSRTPGSGQLGWPVYLLPLFFYPGKQRTPLEAVNLSLAQYWQPAVRPTPGNQEDNLGPLHLLCSHTTRSDPLPKSLAFWRRKNQSF